MAGSPRAPAAPIDSASVTSAPRKFNNPAFAMVDSDDGQKYGQRAILIRRNLTWYKLIPRLGLHGPRTKRHRIRKSARSVATCYTNANAPTAGKTRVAQRSHRTTAPPHRARHPSAIVDHGARQNLAARGSLTGGRAQGTGSHPDTRLTPKRG